MTTLINIVVDGISYGMILFIISVGLTITLGLMRFINLVHGAFAMTGGYVTAWLVRVQGLDFWLSAAIGIAGTAALGAVLESLVLRHLYRRRDLDQVLFTLGMLFVFVATANLIWGPEIRLLPLPGWMAAPVDLGVRTLPAHRLVVVVSGLVVTVGLWALFTRTRFGVWLRAAVDDTAAASALGIPIRFVYALTFALGAGLAALGGILGAEILPLEPYYAMKYMVLVLVVVAVGGTGSVVGSLAAALALGTVESASKYLASDYGNLFFFVGMAVLLLLRPHGMLRRSAP